MIFYCPNCRQEYDIAETTKSVTNSGRVAHKANCPVCQLGLVEFIPGETVDINNESANSGN